MANAANYTVYDDEGNLIRCGGVRLHNHPADPDNFTEEAQKTELIDDNNFNNVLNFARLLQKTVSEIGYTPTPVGDIEKKIEFLNTSLKEKRREIKRAEQEKAKSEKYFHFCKKTKTVCEIIFAAIGFIGGLIFMAFCVLRDFEAIKTLGGILGTFAVGTFFGAFFGIVFAILVNIPFSKIAKKYNEAIKDEDNKKKKAEKESQEIEKEIISLNRLYMELLTGSFSQLPPSAAI